MQIISNETMAAMAAAKRAASEVPDILRTLRERGDPFVRRLGDATLDREVRATPSSAIAMMSNTVAW
jgi:hypothetical protein